jgi:hypothetical protein
MEEATAKSQGALKALREELDKSGPASADFGDNIAQGKKAVTDFVDDLGVAIATSPVVRAGMKAMGEALQGAFGGKQQDTVKILMGFVSSFAIGLTYAGQAGLVAGQVLVTAFYAAKTAIAGVMAVLAGVGTGIVGVIDELAQLGQKIPGHAKWIDTFAASTEGARQFMEGLRQSLADETAEAAKGVMGHSAAAATLDKLGGVLVTVRGAMEAAQRAQGDLTSGAAVLGTGLGQTTEAARLTAAQIKAMEEATMKGMNTMLESSNAMAVAFETLQQEITLANKSGLDQRLAEISIAQQKEIAGLQWIAFEYPEKYEAIVAMVKEKYGIMAADAAASFAVQTQAAISWRDSSVEAANKVLSNAEANLARLAATKGTTEQQMADAHAAVAKAEDDLDQAQAAIKMERFQMIAGAVSDILRTAFGKSKAAAIAAALIDAAAAIVKVFAQFGWWGIPMAAAIAVKTGAEINKIRNQGTEGFAAGSEGFQDFGRGTLVTLHGPEEVITRTQGESLAEMIRSALGDVGRGMSMAAAGAGQLVIPVYIGSEKLDTIVVNRTRTGHMRVDSAGLRRRA